MDGQVPAEVVQERYERLIALVEETSLDGNRQFAGREVEVLVADGEGRKDEVTHRMSGRARDNRLVHFAPAGTATAPGRRGHHRGDPRRAALPDRGRRAAGRPPDQGGGRWAARRERRGEARHGPRGATAGSCSASRPWAVPPERARRRRRLPASAAAGARGHGRGRPARHGGSATCSRPATRRSPGWPPRNPA